MSKPTEKQVATTLSESDYEWLASYAKKEGRSVAGQLRHLILTEQEKQRENEYTSTPAGNVLTP